GAARGGSAARCPRHASGGSRQDRPHPRRGRKSSRRGSHEGSAEAKYPARSHGQSAVGGLVKRLSSLLVAAAVTAAAIPAAAQPASSAAAARAGAEQRYQIGQMERVLEGAVEHGVTVTRDRVQALAQVPADLLVSDNAHARGFRLEGYGVFFDVVVPSFLTTLTWSLRTLDQNDLGLDSAMRTLQTHVKTSGDPNLEQALKRLELQVGPGVLARSSVPAAIGARLATGSAAATNADTGVATASADD